MVITLAFQARFVGSSPIIRTDKVFRGVLKHVKEEMALDTAISQTEVDHSPRAKAREVWIPSMRKHTKKSRETWELKHLSTKETNQPRYRQ
jgi:hypothetical protein